MTPSFTLYKMIVLYMLRRIEFSMTTAQISEFVQGKGYTDYFTLVTSLSELEDAGLIHAETIRNSTYYTITPEGEETVEYFGNRISHELREDIVAYLKENRLRLRNETAVMSDYRRIQTGEYEVRCSVKELQSDLIDLRLVVPEKKQAEVIADRWKKKNDDVYAFIMQELLLKE